MAFARKTHNLILFLGDIAIFTASLWLMLVIRHLQVPTAELFFQHLEPFSILFAVWFAVFFVAGLYEKHTVFFQNELPKLLLKTQAINVALAVLFFYLIPYFGITPKTNLFIYLVISFGLILFWRLYGFGLLGKPRPQKAAIIGGGKEMEELRDEVNHNSHTGLVFQFSIDVSELNGLDIQRDIIERIYSEGVEVVAVDLRDTGVAPLLPHLYNLIFSNVRFYDMHRFYEDIFDRVPLSLVQYSWFLENVSASPRMMYASLKRLIDVICAGFAGVASLVIYPFVIAAIKIDDGGPIFIRQVRIGKNSAHIHTTKFRTMTTDDGGDDTKKGINKNTRVGPFLRKARIDELPQLWDVVRGDISLIGPRPELPSLVEQYEAQIPYYTIRHLIKPGLSGWAQLYHKDPPKRDIDVHKTKVKLSYDLYYIVNRSLLTDMTIALKTIKTLLSRSGK